MTRSDASMVGDQLTGRVPGVVISKVAHEPLKVTVEGKPAQLAIVAEDGTVIAYGAHVAREAAAVAINSYRAMLKGDGHLRVSGEPISPVATVAQPNTTAANCTPKRSAA